MDDWCQIKEFAEACGLVFLASAFQDATVEWLGELEVAATKVASRAVASFPYHAAPEPFLVSLGMYGENENLTDREHIYLECEANYPSTARWKQARPGFSDHSGHPFNAVDAISRGCKILEVHYRIDRIDAGPDLPATLSLDELALVCRARDHYAS